jgi:hypothetical protein
VVGHGSGSGVDTIQKKLAAFAAAAASLQYHR